MFLTSFSLHISVIFSFLYLFYISIYYACFIEETLSLAAAIKAGAEEVAGITRERYMQRLTWLKSATRLSILFNRDDRKKPVFTRISNILENLRLDSADGRIRKQPYCILLTGYPGCGKTGTALRIAAELMKFKYGRFSANDVVTLNETDEFQSEYRTNHKVVIFDDIGAENPNKSTVNPWRKIIDFVNNIRKTSLNPNLELKGNVYIQPDLVIITTNLQFPFSLEPWLVCHSAILRRLSKVLFLRDFDTVVDITPVKVGGTESNTRAYDYNYDTTEEVQKVFGKGTGNNLKLRKSRKLKDAIPNAPTYGNPPTKLDSPSAIHHKERQAPVEDPLDLDRKIEDFVRELVVEFMDHDENQEDYVKKMNALLDPPKSELSAWQSFLYDQVYPRWPKKFILPPNIEMKLPWYQRFARKFCVPHNVAICQSDTSEMDSTEREILISSGKVAFVPDEDQSDEYTQEMHDLSSEMANCIIESTPPQNLKSGSDDDSIKESDKIPDKTDIEEDRPESMLPKTEQQKQINDFFEKEQNLHDNQLKVEAQQHLSSTESQLDEFESLEANVLGQLKTFFNLENYIYFRKDLFDLQEYDIYVVEAGFVVVKAIYGQKVIVENLVHPAKTSKFRPLFGKDRLNVGRPYFIEHLEWFFQKYLLKTIKSPTYSGPINFFHSHTYDLTLDEHHLGGPAFKKLLRNCQRKLPEMGAKGELCDAPSSLLTYQVLRRAFHYKYKPIGVEFEHNGLTFDGLTKIGDTHVIIEAKTRKCPRDDLKRYMKDFAVDAPCIGVGINYFGYVIYYAGDVPDKDLRETAQVCNAVFKFFQRNGDSFRVSIPFRKYKNHDEHFPPPKSICV
jgi:hypothetical protein